MPLLTAFSSSPQGGRPRRSHWMRWAPLALTLTAATGWAQDTTVAPEPPVVAEPAFATEAKNAAPSGIVVHVAPGHQTQFIIKDAERVRVQAPEVVEVAVGEPNQLMVQGLAQGVSEVLVWRQGVKQPLSVRVEVAQ
ncbi:pilus assembly protein N-terminal domain-containing protein [Myxococcus sp. Y35]|uniref:pilus assembly protein N-terminal domain-containing protein n=1 Tax=Pseudomyxococcus flavus TaxID=3115648 RepID=UPI003CED0B8D